MFWRSLSGRTHQMDKTLVSGRSFSAKDSDNSARSITIFIMFAHGLRSFTRWFTHATQFGLLWDARARLFVVLRTQLGLSQTRARPDRQSQTKTSGQNRTTNNQTTRPTTDMFVWTLALSCSRSGTQTRPISRPTTTVQANQQPDQTNNQTTRRVIQTLKLVFFMPTTKMMAWYQSKMDSVSKQTKTKQWFGLSWFLVCALALSYFLNKILDKIWTRTSSRSLNKPGARWQNKQGFLRFSLFSHRSFWFCVSLYSFSPRTLSLAFFSGSRLRALTLFSRGSNSFVHFLTLHGSSHGRGKQTTTRHEKQQTNQDQ